MSFAGTGAPAVALLAAAGGAAFSIPWEVVLVIGSLAVSWGFQLSQLNGFGRRLNDNEDAVRKLEAKAEAAALTAAVLGEIEKRLHRIEDLLDQRVNL